MNISSQGVARVRLQTLGLVDSPLSRGWSTPLDVVHHHLAMQGQDWHGSRWAVGSRLPDATIEDIEAAFNSGSIVRSWPMRGTVHVVAADDLHWMLDVMGVRALSGVQRRWEYLGIDERLLERAREVAIAMLRGGASCSRANLVAALEGEGLDLGGQRAYHTVWYLSQTGTLVHGPVRNGKHELVLLDEWVKHPRKLSREQALAELGRRYLASHGPATIDDLMHWTRLPKRDCTAAIEACGNDLVELHNAGVRYFARASVLEQCDPEDASIDATVLSLAPFDEHLLGYRYRDDVLHPDHATLVDPARNGVFRATIVRGSRVVATWSRKQRAHDTAITVSAFTSLPKVAMRPLRTALDRYGAFTGRPVTLID